MQTAVGVFASRERAEEAVKSLLEHQVPQDRIIFLTRSESEAKHIARQLGAPIDGIADGAAAASAGVGAAAILAIQGVGSVFALGSGATTLIGAAGAEICATDGSETCIPSDACCSEDLEFFRRVLNEGQSVIVVRSDSSQIASTACKILDRFGLSMERTATPRNAVTLRQAHGAVVADMVGKIALAEGTGLLRETIRDFLARGHIRILLNLEGVDFIDSAGLGELVRSHASVRCRSGQLKIVKPSANVLHLLRLTKLDRIFDIEQDEARALASFRQASAASSAG
jgi:anti-sigma B factor antagonist